MSLGEIILKVKLKKEKSEQDKLLLQFFDTMVNISEILVSESKSNIDAETAIKRIRREVDKGIISGGGGRE